MDVYIFISVSRTVYILRHLYTKRVDVLRQDLVMYRSGEILVQAFYERISNFVALRNLALRRKDCTFMWKEALYGYPLCTYGFK